MPSLSFIAPTQRIYASIECRFVHLLVERAICRAFPASQYGNVESYERSGIFSNHRKIGIGNGDLKTRWSQDRISNEQDKEVTYFIDGLLITSK